ncbi:NAD(P)-binding protein [Macroventuria anomochaeta]|uniref:NAD(P)-binding protein n=1 Tax=Macroventuria anomochaeta TaxID=301207 RepID=A0ACB6RZM5_9PLEO|nr:NAD(P)-binding protein [Macroventuria anomochaeta]KAF2627420.1 NAD(P)-binding protein [Macroventuria anomochaeta]
MSYPRTARSWRRTALPYPLSIVPSTETLPEILGPHDVVIRIHAVSLNYRDVAMLREGGYPVPVDAGGICASDASAEVVALGPEASRFKIGDIVAPTIDLEALTGEERDIDSTALGGNGPGVLTEYAVFEDKYLVKLPSHLSWEEASTIPIAGITAWVALNRLQGLTKGATALLQGTGGVSMSALQICLAAGIRPIITSSSDVKLDKLKQLDSRIGLINYKTHPDVVSEVLRLTDGKGVDYVLNNIGVASIPDDLQILRKRGGRVALIGFLEGFEANWSPSLLITLMAKEAHIVGLLGGSKADFEALNVFFAEKEVHLDPLIDRTFSFDDAEAAFDYLSSGKHVGKVVIKL